MHKLVRIRRCDVWDVLDDDGRAREMLGEACVVVFQLSTWATRLSRLMYGARPTSAVTSGDGRVLRNSTSGGGAVVSTTFDMTMV